MDITKSLSATEISITTINKEIVNDAIKPKRKYVRKNKVLNVNILNETGIQDVKIKKNRKPRKLKEPKEPKKPKEPKELKKFKVKKERKEKIKKVRLPEQLCIGRRIDNLQCSRLKCNNEELCKYHLKKLSNGTINDTITKSIPIQHSRTRRGRKRKVDYDPKINDKNYVILWEHVIDDNKYLTDKYGNIYTLDLIHPKFIGIQTLDNKLQLV